MFKKPTVGTVKVTFSEPLSSPGTVTFKKADGSVVNAGGTGITNDFAPGARALTFTLGSDVASNTTVGGVAPSSVSKDSADSRN